MKTLLVTMDFPPLLGGVAEYYKNRIRKMAKANGSIVVLAPLIFVIPTECKLASGKLNGIQKEIKIISKSFFTKFFWPHWLPLIWHIWRVVKKEKITRLWAGQVLPVGTAVWVVSKLLKHRIFRLRQLADPRNDIQFGFFVTCHGNDLLRAKRNRRKFWLAKKILHGAEFVEANTEFTKNILIQDFGVPKEKIKVVYPENTLKKEMIDEKKVSELREKYNLVGKKVLLTVARLVESKGIGQVLRALPKVWEQMPELVYLIVGDGPVLSELVRIANEYLKIPPLTPPCKGGDESGCVIFTGAVPHNELPNYYALVDAFILTPHYRPLLFKEGKGEVNTDIESFGIVYLEAMEFGLPIIAGDVGGAREIKKSPHFQGGIKKSEDFLMGVVNNNFILVNSENIDEIAEKIIMVMK